MTNLSKYVTLKEFERSSTALRRGINNQMPPYQKANATVLCVRVLDVIREHYDRELDISSGYRSRKLNSVIGGSGTSQHCEGEAADFTIRGLSIDQIFDDIRFGRIPGLKFDQLIHEGDWIHISYRKDRLRSEALRATFTKTGVTYRKA